MFEANGHPSRLVRPTLNLTTTTTSGGIDQADNEDEEKPKLLFSLTHQAYLQATPSESSLQVEENPSPDADTSEDSEANKKDVIYEVPCMDCDKKYIDKTETEKPTE